jgi:hypothetical protein
MEVAAAFDEDRDDSLGGEVAEDIAERLILTDDRAVAELVREDAAGWRELARAGEDDAERLKFLRRNVRAAEGEEIGRAHV